MYINPFVSLTHTLAECTGDRILICYSPNKERQGWNCAFVYVRAFFSLDCLFLHKIYFQNKPEHNNKKSAAATAAAYSIRSFCCCFCVRSSFISLFIFSFSAIFVYFFTFYSIRMLVIVCVLEFGFAPFLSSHALFRICVGSCVHIPFVDYRLLGSHKSIFSIAFFVRFVFKKKYLTQCT